MRQRVAVGPFQFPNPPFCDPAFWTQSEPFAQIIANPLPAPTSSATMINTFTADILGDLDPNSAEAKARTEAYFKTAAANVPNPADHQDSDLVAGFTASGSTNHGTLSRASSSLRAKTNTRINPAHASAKIFKGRKVYLTSDLMLRPGLEQALMERIVEAGGECWSWGIDGERVVNKTRGRSVDQWEKRRVAQVELASSNTVVTFYREGWEFWHVSRYFLDKTRECELTDCGGGVIGL